MDIRECYDKCGGSFDEVLGRMMNKESLVQKFLLKFLEDTSYSELTAALAAKDGQTAFRAAHTMKGVCQNLALSKLADSSSKLTEALRGGEITAEASALYEQVAADYAQTTGIITEFQSQAAG